MITIVFSNYTFSVQKVIPEANEQCNVCHQQSTKDWKKSDHVKAMAVANKVNVLGDFDKITATHYGEKALFFIKNNTYQVTIPFDKKIET